MQNNQLVPCNGNLNEFYTEIGDIGGINRSKALAFIMMSVSLVAANANQLKHAILSTDRSTLFYMTIGILIASTIFQMLAKICELISYRKYDLSNLDELKKLKFVHRFTITFTILVVLLNLVLTAITFAEFLKYLHFINWITLLF